MSFDNAREIAENELKKQHIVSLIQKHISASRRSTENKPQQAEYSKKKHKSYEKVGRKICIHNNKKLRNQVPKWSNSEKVTAFIIVEMSKHRRWSSYPDSPPDRKIR